mgnify:FL=1
MRQVRNLWRLFFVCSFALSVLPAIAEGISWQAAAQRFAGLEATTGDPAYTAFQKRAAAAWERYDKQIGQPLANWAKREVDYAGGGTVFYPFSGPDFVTVARVYPNAERYVLVAMQHAGRPVAPGSMRRAELRAFESRLGAAWEKFGRLGYFRTIDLDDDQRAGPSRLGTITILMAFAARLGYEVTALAPLSFNAGQGEWEVVSSDEKWKSVRLTLQKDGKKATVDYLSLDLSDSGLQRAEPQQAWIKRMSAQPALLKAASHLLQQPNFVVVRDALVLNSPLVVQDETGLDHKDLVRIGGVRLYGHFRQAHSLFRSTTQRSLAAAYKAEKAPGELPFAFSYLVSSGARSMQVARRDPAPEKRYVQTGLPGR